MSSSLAALGWKAYKSNQWNGNLAVQFQTKDGSWSGYLYEDVPMEVFVQTITADSQGATFAQIVKGGGYLYRKVTPAEVQQA